MVTRVSPAEKETPPQRVTRIVPVIKSHTQLSLDLGISPEEETYTLDQIKNYLNSDSLDQARHLIAG
jgi:hypothetical protein